MGPPVSLVDVGLLLIACSSGAAFGAVLLPGVRARAGWAGGATCLVGLGGLLAGAGALAEHGTTMTAPRLLPTSQAVLDIDPLSGLFMLMVGAVAVAAGIYSLGYPHRHAHEASLLHVSLLHASLLHASGTPRSSSRASDPVPASFAEPGGVSSRTVTVALPLFVAAMVLVPAAGNVTTFLVLWELMAVLSLVLVLAEHRQRSEVGQAGIWYAAMTHAGLVAILLGLVMFSTAAGTESFAGMRDAASSLSPTTRTVVFLLVLVGFGSKAGLVPLHVWLPRAHPEAPSYVSALMSAAMVNLGLYGVLRVGFNLLGGGQRWWWLLVLSLGAISALYGVLQASVATDFKKLLAYSTTENLGLIFIGVGAAGIFAAAGDTTLANLLMVAALLHTVNHAAFKTLLFLGAGAVLRSTGLRNLDKMGGLARQMPATTALVGIGALAASGLPPGNGFVSEWLLLQGLIHSLTTPGDVMVAIAMPLAVGAVALTAGLGVATFVKAFGVGFLARPRSPQAATATPVPGTLRLGMSLAALACATLALVPTLLVDPLERVLGTMGAISGRAPVRGPVLVNLTGISGSMSPLLIALGLAGGAVAVSVLVRAFSARQPRRTALVWGSGGTRLSPRMEYTATAYAEPLTRVFDDVLRPEHDIDVTHHAESRYLVESVRYRGRVPDRIEARLYPPLWILAQRWAGFARRLQNGSVHAYLAYGLVGLLAVLVVLQVTS